MAVAHDAASESHTGTTGDTSSSSFSWTHGGRAEASGGIQGVLVFVHNATSGTNDNSTAVSYGGVALAAVGSGRAVDTAGEPGECKAWFVGTGLIGKGGNQTIIVTRTNNADVMYATAVTVTAEGDTTTGTPVLLQGDGTLAESSVDDGSPGSNSVRYAAIFSGLATPPSAGASSTALTNIDFSALGCAMVRETTAGQGSRSVGFSSGTSDDRAGVAVAVKIASVTLRATSDPLSITILDSDITSFELATFDRSLTGLTEASAVSINGLILKSTSDAMALGLTENAVILSTQSTSDPLSIGLTENAVILVIQPTSDNAGMGLAENAASSTALATSDSLVFGLSDPDITSIQVATSDLIVDGLTELATVSTGSLISAVGSELIPLALTETATIVSTGMANDPMSTGLVENAAILKIQATSDPLAIGFTETATQVVSLATSDSMPAGLSEVATERVNENRTDSLLLGLTESTNLNTGNLVQISASDSLRFVVNDPDITSFELKLIDPLPLALTESATAGDAPVPVIPIATSDSIAFVIDEPYTDDTQVIASDSVRMGLVETAAVVDLTGGSTTVSASDPLKAGLTELAVVKVIAATSDAVALVIDEPYTDDTQVIASDAPRLGLVETATVVDLSAGLVTQSTSELLPFLLTEAVSIKANFYPSDAVVMGLTEFATIEVNEQVLRTTPDSVVLGLNELADVVLTQPASENVVVGLSENADIVGTLDTTSDQVVMGLQETANIVDLSGGPAFVTSAESFAMGLTEDASSFLNSPLNDDMPMGLIESATIAVVLVASDTVGVGLTDASSMQVNISASDTLPVGLAEAILQTIAASAQDGVGFVLDDSVNAVRALLSATDAVVFGLTDHSDLIDVGGIAQKTSSDSLAVHITDNGVVHSVIITGPSVLVATVEYLGPKTAELVGLPKEAELWTP